jgi:hypothetical protein
MKTQPLNPPSLSQRFIAAIGSRKFFIVIVMLLGVQAIWIALTGKYPMAFDEDFHFGLIQLYAHHIGPFWTTQPAGGDMYGALTRDPSYMFQFLMSFPYRLIRIFTNDQTIQVILLRFINVGLFLSGLPIYRLLLLKTGASKAIVHAVLLLFVLIPIVPLLVGQINYDNMLFPLVGLTLLLAIRVITSIESRMPIARSLFLFGSVGLFASLVKYAFLPIFVAATVVIVVVFLRAYGFRTLRLSRKSLISTFAGRASKLSFAVFMVMLVLAFERYGINVLRYHTPVPECNQVLSVAQCRSYGPWVRDFDLVAVKTAKSNPVSFTGQWIQGMWIRTFFTLAGPSNDFETRGPFIVPAISAIIFAGLGIGAVAIKRRKIWQSRPLIFVLLSATSLFYLLVLFLQQYKLYAETGVPVAINGRYLIFIAPFLILIGALGARQFMHSRSLKIGAAAITVGCMALGGGALTYILRSNDGWYWPSSPARTANHAVQKTLGPAIPGYKYPTAFLPYP